MGYVDLHCHLLWGVDDGCETPDETLAAARLLVGFGFSDVAPSPHALAELPSGDADHCDRRRADVAELLAREGVPLALHRNAENRLDDAFMARAGGPERRGVGASGRWVLVEAPFQAELPALPELITRLRAQGVLPLLAHPERCAELQRPGRAKEAVRRGAALQLNVGALAGLYGKKACSVAERLLAEGLYAVAGTDLHGPHRAPEWLDDALIALEKRAGRAEVERLFSVNPRRVLAGEELG
jgi:protein-tyrosine phosphatase